MGNIKFETPSEGLRLGSLFDGIGGFPLAAAENGIVPVWASEIEAFPIQVTKLRFPNMFHAGDITKIRGEDLPAVDIVTGGSPCQDLSIAGKRAGLSGNRSGLFMEQIRVVKEMRQADANRKRRNTPADLHGIVPRFMVWENVPGAFSSLGGEDFRAVLEETCRIADSSVSIPRPAAGKWKPAGAILGRKFSVAWRVLDAQYWGVPQRRKRIFLVADFGGMSAPKILFEQESMYRNPAPRLETRQRIAGSAPESTGNPGGVESRRTVIAAFSAGAGASAGSIGYQEELSPTLKGTPCGNMAPAVLCFSDQIRRKADGGDNSMEYPLVFENHGIDSRYTGPHWVSPTISARCGTGGNNLPLAVQEPESFCIAGNIIDREPENGGNGLGYQANVSYTLNTADRHAVFTRQRSDGFLHGNITGAQTQWQYKDTAAPGCPKNPVENRSLIRRLTPLECERLQGYPDGWTLAPGASDSVRYKALGNSVAIPCAAFVLRGVALAAEKERERGKYV